MHLSLEETEPATLSCEQYLAIEQLRLAGWAVVLWSPNELGKAPANDLETLTKTYGNRMRDILVWPTPE